MSSCLVNVCVFVSFVIVSCLGEHQGREKVCCDVVILRFGVVRHSRLQFQMREHHARTASYHDAGCAAMLPGGRFE